MTAFIWLILMSFHYFVEVFPVHIPEVVSDLQQAIPKPVLAIANVKDADMFRWKYYSNNYRFI